MNQSPNAFNDGGKWVDSYCLVMQNWLSCEVKGRWVHLRALGRSKH